MSLELINEANYLIQKTINLSDEDISKEALEFIKTNKEEVINKYLLKKDISKKAYFLSGGVGAGKTELAQSLKNRENIDVIEADEIRKIWPHYSGKNSSLFQKTSSKAVSILVDTAFKKDYDIEIFFVYRPLKIAKEYIEIREDKDGLNIAENVFYENL